MKKILLTMLLLASSMAAFAQKDTIDFLIPREGIENPYEEEIFTVTEIMPEFPGGKDTMMAFIWNNIKYPQMAEENAFQGRVVVGFVVNEEGKLEDIRILKDIGGGCGEEAVRVVKMMPDWKPGMQRGKIVKVRYTLPVTFEKETPQAETQQEDLIYTIVEEQPEFPGGYDKMMQFLATNIKYPKKAKKKGIEGRVVVQFVVNKQGELEDIKIVKDIGAGCGEEAVRVIKTMPKWKPGYQGGKVVKVRYNVPIKFILSK